jgi:TrmH family RNA methyltransferase
MKFQTITSTTNAQIKAIRQLSQKSSSYKTAGQIWLEGEHLCDAYLLALAKSNQNQSVLPALQTVVLSLSAKPYWTGRLEAMLVQGLLDIACEAVIVSDALFESLSGLPSSGGLGFVLKVPQKTVGIQKTRHTVILDGVQDAGNVGSILRSAAAFGVTQVLALQGTAALWSPKVLRAAMGAHFSLHLVEDLSEADIQLDIPIFATHVHAGAYLHELQTDKKIPNPCAWVMGSEGQGVSQAMLDKASQRVNIKQMGEESLNVAAAAAVCMFASMQASD